MSASLRSRLRGFTFVDESAIEKQFDDEGFEESSYSNEPAVVVAGQGPSNARPVNSAGRRAPAPDSTDRPPTPEDFSVFNGNAFELLHPRFVPWNFGFRRGDITHAL